MSYSSTVKMQYYGLGMATGFVMASILALVIAGMVFIHAGTNMALNGLSVPQSPELSGTFDDVLLDNGLQGSSVQLQPAVNLK